MHAHLTRNNMSQKALTAAGLDIGTNTILMAIAKRDANGNTAILSDQHSVARLGADVDKTGRISDEAIARACAILARYKTLCSEHQVSSVFAVATSAMRDASNSSEVRRQLEAAFGFPIHVIDGEHEARLSFLGASPGGPSTVIDIGGGSTEIVSGNDAGPAHARSLEIGAVRLSERHFPALPPDSASIEAARSSVREHLKQIGWSDFGTLVGVGGTPTSLAAMALKLDQMQPEKLDGITISAQQISELCAHLLTIEVETIRNHPAIHPHRADILPMGAIILDEIMQFCGACELQISIRGLRYGALLQALGSKRV